MFEPVHRLLHGRSGQLAGDRAANLPAGDQAGIRQHVEVLHDGGQRDGKRPGEIADRHGLLALELGDQSAPGGVGKRGEGAVERGGLILNHVVKYREWGPTCQQGKSWQGNCHLFPLWY